MNLEKIVHFSFLGIIGLCLTTAVLYLNGVFGERTQIVQTAEIEENLDDILTGNIGPSPGADVETAPERYQVLEEKPQNELPYLSDYNAEDRVEPQVETLYEGKDDFFTATETLVMKDETRNRRPEPFLLPANTVEKYYIARGEPCTLVDYQCEPQWDHFTDEVGCGCKKQINTSTSENQSQELEPYPEIKSEWGQNLNPNQEAPLNSWQAFYFSTDEPDQVVETELVDRVSVNFSWTDMDIEAEEFAAYWVGDWEFSQATEWAISVSQGWSKSRIIINDQLVYAGDNSEEFVYTFAPGTHRIEVEYLNAWHTVEFSINFGEPIERIPNQSVPAWLARNDLNEVPLGLISVYESNSFDTRIPVTFPAQNEPIVLLLASYSGVEWNLAPLPAWVKGVVVASYEPSTRAVGVPEKVPLVYLSDYVDVPFGLQPQCSRFGGHSHCDHTGLVGIDKVTEPLFNRTPKYFSGAYNTPGMTMPDLTISEDLRENITAAYEAWKRQQQAVKQKQTDFDSVFD